MTVVEQIKLKAGKLARQTNITEAAAYALVLERNPELYRLAEEERSNSGAVGTTGSQAYAREARRSGSLRR
jgi:hypothetical protein